MRGSYLFTPTVLALEGFLLVIPQTVLTLEGFLLLRRTNLSLPDSVRKNDDLKTRCTPKPGAVQREVRKTIRHYDAIALLCSARGIRGHLKCRMTSRGAIRNPWDMAGSAIRLIPRKLVALVVLVALIQPFR